MTLVDMKCRSCGAALRVRDDCLVCDYCGSIYFRLTDNDNADVTHMSAEEFAESVEKSRKTYCVRLSEGKIYDADARLIAAAKEAAEDALHAREFWKTDDLLKNVPSDDPAACRIKLLSAAGARNESELALWSGDLTSLPEYARLTAVCDDDTRAVYALIARKCAENAAVRTEINKGHEFLRLGKTAEGLRYAEDMIRRQPYRAAAWDLLMTARCLNDASYDPTEDLRRLTACPDVSVTFGGEDDIPRSLSPALRDRCLEVRRKKNAKSRAVYKNFIRPVAVAIGVAALLGIWGLISLVMSCVGG